MIQGMIQGIDVYGGDGAVDWAQVKKEGFSFGIVKKTEGLAYKDPAFDHHWQTLKMDGLIRGAYHFFKPSDDGSEQARFFMDGLTLEPGDFPPIIDFEVDDGQDFDALSSGLKGMISSLQEIMKERKLPEMMPILYTYPSFWTEQMRGSWVFSECPLWIAEYDVSIPKLPNGFRDYFLHQYAGDATVNGVENQCDISRDNPLKYGSMGARVKQVQQAVGINDTGVYDHATATAVADFQAKHKLEPTGIVDLKTWLCTLWHPADRV